MTDYLKQYLSLLEPKHAESVEVTVKNVLPQIEEAFLKSPMVNGMLLGNVQSGKTGHMFGVIAAAAEVGYATFILLTTDNVALQQQTFTRALDVFPDFVVCSETDDLRFNQLVGKRPVLAVLKKNPNVLKSWYSRFASVAFCKDRPLFLIDDEADAASLNTKVNKREQSQINKYIDQIKKISTGSIYLQVTATPQAIILQTKLSGFKPDFVAYFSPGAGYLGGDFFYSERGSYAIRETAENELEDIQGEFSDIPTGLRNATMSFLVSSAHIMSKGGRVCNFLIHPSVRISDHRNVFKKISGFLNELLSVDNKEIEPHLKKSWEDLQKTKPDIIEFQLVKNWVFKALEEEAINIIQMNSESTDLEAPKDGANIIVGGNTLGRGITFPCLQTVYYCRKSKKPQADTFWQHCRMFGYDRDSGLMRIYIPFSLRKLFTDLNTANTALIKQILVNKIENISLLYPPEIKPTRTNVLDKESLNVLVGGVNFFPSYIKEDSPVTIDKLLEDYDESKASYSVPVDFLIELLSKIKTEPIDDWTPNVYINALKAWKASNEPGCLDARLIVRRDRSIGRNTGTLLSETDRATGDSIKTVPVLTMYRILGEKDKKWSGSPLWIPNIKLPEGKTFYKTEK